MFSKVTYDGNQFLVHSTEDTASVTRSFTHGTIVFGPGTVSFGKSEPIAMEMWELIGKDYAPKFQLLDAAGQPKKQTRQEPVTVRKVKLAGESKFKEIFVIPGKSQSEPLYPASEGWTPRVIKFRAYMTHPGVTTDPNPEWLQASNDRKRMLWNHLCWIVREARRACSNEDPTQVKAFIENTIKPAFEEFNKGMGREKTKLKMKVPSSMNVEEPTTGAIWGMLKKFEERTKEGKPVPDALIEPAKAFISQFKADLSPIFECFNTLDTIIEHAVIECNCLLAKEGKEPLRWWEHAHIADRFKSVMSRRKKQFSDKSDQHKQTLSFAKGWPRIKYENKPGYSNWALRRMSNWGGDLLSDLLQPSGAIFLQFGPKIYPWISGHPLMGSLDRPGKTGTRKLVRRHLRQVTLTMKDRVSKTTNSMRFAVLQTQEFPEQAMLKGWELVHKDGNYWLCLIVLVKMPVAVSYGDAAGLDIGWRVLTTKKAGKSVDELPLVMRLGMLYDPQTKNGHEIRLDMGIEATGPESKHARERAPFTVEMGPNRWLRRNAKWNREHREEITRDPSLIRQEEGDFHSLRQLQKERSQALNNLKEQIKSLLGDDTPAFLQKMGSNGLRKHFFKSDREEVRRIVTAWDKEDARLGHLTKFLWDRKTARLKKGYEYVANDICRFLVMRQEPVYRLAVEEKFLKMVAEVQHRDAPEAVKASMRMRQWASLSSLLNAIRNAAAKYGISVVATSGLYSTLKCSSCLTVAGQGSAEMEVQCKGCGAWMDQDFNAAKNLANAVNPQHDLQPIGFTA